MRRLIISIAAAWLAGASTHPTAAAQQSGGAKATLFTGARLITDGDKPPIEDSSFLLTILFAHTNKERQTEASLSEPGYPNLPSSFLKSRQEPTTE